MYKPIKDDTHSDYHSVKKLAKESMRNGVWENRCDERFEVFLERMMRSDLSRESIQSISAGKNYMHYLGVPMAKDPLDKAIYEMLMYEIQPKTIIELGAYTGASACWLADTMKHYGCETQVIAVDIDLSLIDEKFKDHPHVQFREGDCHKIETLFPVAELKELLHPVLLIDDAHVNLPTVYDYFHDQCLQTGDYLIIEDTNPAIPGTFGMSTDGANDWGDWKHREIIEFFQRRGEDYRVDTYYTDFFGYNGTWNWNGFIRRM